MYRCGGCDSPAQNKCLCYEVSPEGDTMFTHLGQLRRLEDKYPNDRPLPQPITDPARMLEISKELKEKLQEKQLGYITEYA